MLLLATVASVLLLILRLAMHNNSAAPWAVMALVAWFLLRGSALHTWPGEGLWRVHMRPCPPRATVKVRPPKKGGRSRDQKERTDYGS